MVSWQRLSASGVTTEETLVPSQIVIGEIKFGEHRANEGVTDSAACGIAWQIPGRATEKAFCFPVKV